MLCLLISLVISSDFIYTASGSGVMYDPPSRAVMFKYQFPVERNYDYMRLNCGGIHQEEFGRKQCGICGDPPNGPKEHEAGGKYGTRMISRYLPQGTKELEISVELTDNKKGFFEFRLCVANNKPATQKCFDDIQLPIKEGYLAGTPLRFYPKKTGDFHLTVALPPKLVCDRCVIQWRYRTGESWGKDPVTKKRVQGIGPQEEFYNCADIRVGGSVPETLKRNPYFAPPDHKQKVVVVDKPTVRRKALAKIKGSGTGPAGNATHTESSVTIAEAVSAMEQQLALGMKVGDSKGKMESLQLDVMAGSAGLEKGLDVTKKDHTGTHSVGVDFHGQTGTVGVTTADSGVQVDFAQVGLKTHGKGKQISSKFPVSSEVSAQVLEDIHTSKQLSDSSAVEGLVPDKLKVAESPSAKGNVGIQIAASEVPLESGIVKAIGVDIGTVGASPTQDGIRTVGVPPIQDGIIAVDASATQDGIRATGASATQDGIRADGVSPTQDGIRAVGAFPAHDGIRVDGASPTQDGIRAVGALPIQDGIRAVDASPTQDGMRAEVAFPTQDGIRAEGASATQDGTRPVGASPTQDGIRAGLRQDTGETQSVVLDTGTIETGKTVINSGKTLPVDSITPLSSKQNIPFDVQSLKHADMSEIISHMNLVADQGSTSADMPGSSFMSHSMQAADQGTLHDPKILDTHNRGGSLHDVGQTVETKQEGSATPLAIDTQQSVLQSELGSVGFKTGSNGIQAASTDMVFTGKTIQGLDPVAEIKVERGLNRETIPDPIAQQTANDISLLSSSDLQSVDMKENTPPVEPTVDAIPVDSTADVNVYHPINSGPLHPDEKKEKSHHNRTKKTEKTIQQVTTKNISLPNGSNIVETKLKTVEVKVTETTKLSAEKNGAKKKSDTSKKKSAHGDLVAAAKQDIIQKASAESTLPIEAVRKLTDIQNAAKALIDAEPQTDGGTMDIGTAATLDPTASEIDKVVEMALNNVLEHSGQTESAESSHLTESLQTPEQPGISGKGADINTPLSAESQNILDTSSVKSAISNGLAKLAKATKKRGNKKRKSRRKGKRQRKGKDINLTSKKAKINISHDNSKRTVSEVDLSALKPKKTQPDVAFIIVGSEGNEPASTLKGLAQSLDQVNQLEAPTSAAESVPTIAGTPEQIDLRKALAAEISAAGTGTILSQGTDISKQSKGPIITASETGVSAEEVLPVIESQLTPVSSNTKDSILLSRADSSIKSNMLSASGNTKDSSLRRSKGKSTLTSKAGESKVSSFPPSGGNELVGTAKLPTVDRASDSRMRVSRISGGRRRATSHVGDKNAIRTQGLRRQGRRREIGTRSFEPDASLSTFPSGLTDVVRLGPDSGRLAPELRVEFDRQRQGRRPIRTGDSRLAGLIGGVRRIDSRMQTSADRTLDGRSGRLLMIGGEPRFFPATGFNRGDREGAIRSATSGLVTDPRTGDRYRLVSDGELHTPVLRHGDIRERSLAGFSRQLSVGRGLIPGGRLIGRTRDGRDIIVIERGMDRLSSTDLGSGIRIGERTFRRGFDRTAVQPTSFSRGSRRGLGPGPQTISRSEVRFERPVSSRPALVTAETSLSAAEMRSGRGTRVDGRSAGVGDTRRVDSSRREIGVQDIDGRRRAVSRRGTGALARSDIRDVQGLSGSSSITRGILSGEEIRRPAGVTDMRRVDSSRRETGAHDIDGRGGASLRRESGAFTFSDIRDAQVRSGSRSGARQILSGEEIGRSTRVSDRRRVDSSRRGAGAQNIDGRRRTASRLRRGELVRSDIRDVQIRSGSGSRTRGTVSGEEIRRLRQSRLRGPMLATRAGEGVRLGRVRSGEHVRLPYSPGSSGHIPYTTRGRIPSHPTPYIAPPMSYPRMDMSSLYSGGVRPLYPSGTGFMGSYSPYPYSPMGPLI